MKILSLLAAYAVAKVASLDPYLRTVGVLTMPPQENDRLKGHGHYITEMADIWMRSGGLFPVYIPYNISDADLYPILDQINGVFFTGGDLDLYNETSGTPHNYTVTARKILDYALKQNDQGDYFPLLGVCQGHELLHMLVANDKDALGWSKLDNTPVNTVFTDDDPQGSSRFFRHFSREEIQAMREENILYHYHHRSIPILNYLRYPKLQEFFRVLSYN